MVAHPLFQTEDSGSIPTSPLQLNIARINKLRAMRLNERWHSSLPDLTNWQGCDGFGAEFDGKIYAVALWSAPSARELNGRNWYELRRFAICADAPRFTATRMLRVMRLIIQRERTDIVKLISYQDTDAHKGTIYKAAGWTMEYASERIEDGSAWHDWTNRPGRSNQSLAPKNRWAFRLRADCQSAVVPMVKNGELF